MSGPDIDDKKLLGLLEFKILRFFYDRREQGATYEQIMDGMFPDADVEELGELAQLFTLMLPDGAGGLLPAGLIEELADECRRRANEPRGHA